jgi:biotin-[acetyl-CoA-carboxylase] ligase BirA-like protein
MSHTEKYANKLIHECESTNDIGRLLAEERCADGTWIAAVKQTGGRGRAGREWVSLGGNLFVSVVKTIAKEEVLSWAPLAAAIGVADSLRTEFPGILALVKWPNDLMLAEKKVGGILCETVRGSSRLIIGIGLNCVASPAGPGESDGIDQQAECVGSFLTDATRKDSLAETMRPAVVASVNKWIDLLFTSGPAAIERQYENWSFLNKGDDVCWFEGQEGIVSEAHGRVLGLGQRGELEVEHEGNRRLLFSEDVKLRASR